MDLKAKPSASKQRIYQAGRDINDQIARRLVWSRTYMHWTAVSAARGASRAAELAAKVTSAQDVLSTSGLLATAMEMPNIDRILAVNITV